MLYRGGKGNEGKRQRSRMSIKSKEFEEYKQLRANKDEEEINLVSYHGETLINRLTNEEINQPIPLNNQCPPTEV